MTIRFLAVPLVMVAILFGSAGRWDLPLVWAYIAVLVAFIPVFRFTMDPGLVQERLRPGPGGKDRHIRLIAFPLVLCHWVFAMLDIGRFHWSDTIPYGFRVAGLIGLAVSLGMAVWAMSVNPFFSPVVRIQHERGHRLVTEGPYRFVRHPGYVSSLLSCVFGSLVLGSWWGAVPITALIFVILRRTALEDRYLQQELEGYAEYAKRVRYRLVPGLW